jgi:histidinol-phosphate aminotransferase
LKTVDIDRFVQPHLLNIKSYEPADPLELMAEKAGIAPGQIIRLNANENPYGASPKVSEALARLATHIYPDPLQRKIRGELGKYTGVDPANIVCGAGSDELIDLLFRLFVSPGASIIDCDPTFGMYSFCARIADAQISSVPRDHKFDIDLPAVMSAIDSDTRMIIVNSPNNPTGNTTTLEQVRALLDTGLMVVVDEAYYEFCGETAAGLVAQYENLVVLRTFSKWAGIAGLRVGYGIMSHRLVRHIIDVKSPYNVNTAGEAALLASLEDADALLRKVRLIVEERGRMFSLLKDIPGVEPWPSGGNYILCELEPGRAPVIHNGLAKRGIFVRKFSHERLRDFFRISVGTPEQTDAVISAVAELV